MMSKIMTKMASAISHGVILITNIPNWFLNCEKLNLKLLKSNRKITI